MLLLKKGKIAGISRVFSDTLLALAIKVPLNHLANKLCELGEGC